MRAVYYEVTQRRGCVRVNRYTERQYEEAKARREVADSVKHTAMQCAVLAVGFVALLLAGSMIEALTPCPWGTILMLLGCMFGGGRLLALEEEKRRSGGKGQSKHGATGLERDQRRPERAGGVMSAPNRGNRGA